MLTSPHAAFGAMLGAVMGTPAVVVPMAVGGHYALDMLPHWQETLAPYQPTWRTWLRIPFDLALAASITALLVYWHPERALAIISGAIAANLPDTDVSLIVWPKLRRGWLAWHYHWHCVIQQETAAWWGLLPQAAVMALAVWAGWYYA